jgi:hypothetical protein
VLAATSFPLQTPHAGLFPQIANAATGKSASILFSDGASVDATKAVDTNVNNKVTFSAENDPVVWVNLGAE